MNCFNYFNDCIKSISAFEPDPKHVNYRCTHPAAGIETILMRAVITLVVAVVGVALFNMKTKRREAKTAPGRNSVSSVTMN